MEKSYRVSSAPYTREEKSFVGIMIQKFKAIECKKTDGASLEDKNKAWEKVTEAFNSNYPSRTTKQLKKLWDNLKTSTRKKDTLLKQEQLKTGGGTPPKEDNDPLSEIVRSAVPGISMEIKNPYDCNLRSSVNSVNYSKAFEVIDVPQKKNAKWKCSDESEDDADMLSDVPQKKNAKWKWSDESEEDQDINDNMWNEQKENVDTSCQSLMNPTLDTTERNNGRNAKAVEQKKQNIETCIGERRSFKKIVTPKSTGNSKIKGTYFDEEKNLRILKLKEAIQQQRELHLLKVEIGKAEQVYWEQKNKLGN